MAGLRRKKDETDEDFAARKEAAQHDAAPAQAEPARGRGGRSMLGELIELISVPNAILSMFPAAQEDALSEEEVQSLGQALDRYQQTSPKARKFLRKTTERSGIAGLIIVVMMIAIPRLARHGLLPFGTAQQLQDVAAQAEATARADATGPAPVFTPAVPAYAAERHNGGTSPFGPHPLDVAQ